MSETQPGAGVITVTPDQAAALPGPPVDLPQLTTPTAPEPQVVDIFPRDPAPDPAPVQAEQDAGAPQAVPTPVEEGQGAQPAPAAPAPQQQDGQAGAPVPTRELRGPRGTVAAVPDNIVEVSGLFDRLRSMARVRPQVEAPPVRPQDFVEVDRRRIMVRAATADEMDEVARLAGQQTPQQVRLISTRGDYMPTDVQEFISAVRLANEALFTEARRGVRTREQMIAAAQEMGLDGAVDMLLRRQPGETFNAEQLLASGLALVNAQRETADAVAALQAAQRGTPEHAAALRRAGLNHALTAAIAAQTNGAVAEAGRALGTLRFVADALAQQPPDVMRDLAQRMGTMPAGGLTDEAIIDMLGGADVIEAQAGLWAALPDAASRARFAQRSVGTRVMDAVIAAYVNSLLWLPSTHIKNLLGTGTMMLWSVPERFLAGAVGAVRSRIPGMSDERVGMEEALAQLYGIWAGQGEALAAAADAFRSGMPAGGASRLELPRANPISAEALQLSGTMGRAVDLLGVVLTAPGRALVTADSYFQTIGARMEFLAQAVRQRDAMLAAGVPRQQVETEIMAMLANPPEAWRDAAEASARAMVFQQDMTGRLAQLRDVMQQPIAKLFVPFFNTPTNVARAVLNRTPVALLYPSQAWADLRAGGARADLATSRIALGSAALWWMSGAVMNSANDPDFRITGAAPTQPARREGWQRQGLQAYSICSRADGKWTCQAYSALDPLTGLLAMAADTANYTLDNPTADDAWTGGAEEMAMGAVFGLYNYLLQQPFLTGVSELSKVMGDTRLDAQERARRMVELLTQKATDAVMSPLTLGTLGAGIERSIDPTSRSTLPTDPAIAQEGPILRGFYAALRRAEGRIPGQSADMEPVLNIWGDEVRPNEGGLWPMFWPFRTTEGMTSRMEEALMRLGGVISLPDRKFPGTAVELTAAQYNALVRRMNAPDNPGGQQGMTMQQEMADLVEGGAFEAMTPAEQIDALRAIRSKRWRAAQEDVLGVDFDLNARVTRDRVYRETFGRSPRPDADAAVTIR